MKTKVGILSRLMVSAIAIFTFASFAMAEGNVNEVYLTGSSGSSAGDYVVQTTDEAFYFQGQVFDVFEVFYDNPEMNMKIAVNEEGPCRSFVAFTGEFMFFYLCNQNGFGVRKVMFSNPWTKDSFDPVQYHEQSVLLKKKRIERKQAVGLIASYVPQLKV